MTTFSEKTYLITGAAGFIASHICDFLCKNGAKQVIGLDNLATGFQENIDFLSSHSNFKFLKFDLTDFESCKEAVKGVDIICNQAAIGSVPRSVKTPEYTCHSNIQGFVNLVSAAHQEGIKRFVYASSSSVYGDEPNLPKVEHRIGKPLSPYAISKFTNEIMARNFGELYQMEFVGFRYFNVFGPRQSPQGAYAAVIPLFIQGCKEGSIVYINGDGENTRDFTYVDNVVQANILAMHTENSNALNQVYNIGCGGRYSINQLYHSIANAVGSPQKPEYRGSREGDIKDSQADISKAKELLGYSPKIDFFQGLELTVSSFM